MPGSKLDVDLRESVLVAASKLKRVANMKSKAQKRRKFIILPNDPRKVAWDCFVGIWIVWSVVIIPYRIAFGVDTKGAQFVFDLVIDGVFWIDMVLVFHTAIIKEEVHIYNRWTIAKEYFQGWFWIDLASTLPFDIVIPILLVGGGDSNSIRSIKLVRTLRLIRLFKLARLFKLKKISQGRDLETVNPSLVKLFQLLARIVFVAHLIACAWFFVNECKSAGDHTVEELDDQDWVSCGGLTPESQYVTSMYFTIATMMAVGYGDIFGTTVNERVFALITQLLGATAFGFIIATVTLIVHTWDPAATAKKKRIDEVQDYLVERRVAISLKKAVAKHVEFYCDRIPIFTAQPALATLPDLMKARITFHVHEETMRKMKLFDDCHIMFIVDMITKMKPMQAEPSQYIAKKGDFISECYFVDKGRVHGLIPVPGGREILFGIFQKGFDVELRAAMEDSPSRGHYMCPMQTTLFWVTYVDMTAALSQNQSIVPLFHARVQKENELITKVLEMDSVRTREGIHIKEKILCDGALVPYNRVDFTGVDATAIACRRESERRHSSRMYQGLVNLAKGMNIDLSATPRVIIKPVATLHRIGNNIMEDTETYSDLRSRLIWYPGDPLKMNWDMFMGVLIVVAVTIIPVRIGFDLPTTSEWEIIDYVTDGMFLIDIIFSFRTAYLDDNGLYVTLPDRIRDHYMAWWFWIDLFTTVPIDKVVETISGSGGPLRSLKLVRALRLFRLVKLVRVLKLGKVEAIQDLTERIGTTPVRIFKLMLILMFIGHFFGCFWSYNSLQSGDPNDWESTTWWGADGIDESDIWTRYVASLYWAFTTMTTVGYGDILAVNDAERFFATIIMFVGATVFGYTVGSLSSLATRGSAAQIMMQEQLMEVQDYLKEQGCGVDLQRAVRVQVQSQLRHRTAMDEDGVLAEMPYGLRRQVLSSAYRGLIPKLGLFRGQEISFIIELVTELSSVFTYTGAYYWLPSVGSDGTYFITDGIVERVTHEDNKIKIKGILDRSGMFGHEWLNSEPDIYGYRAFTNVTCMVLYDNRLKELTDQRRHLAKLYYRRVRRMAAAEKKGVKMRRGESGGDEMFDKLSGAMNARYQKSDSQSAAPKGGLGLGHENGGLMSNVRPTGGGRQNAAGGLGNSTVLKKPKIRRRSFQTAAEVITLQKQLSQGSLAIQSRNRRSSRNGSPVPGVGSNSPSRPSSGNVSNDRRASDHSASPGSMSRGGEEGRRSSSPTSLKDLATPRGLSLGADEQRPPPTKEDS
uniref:Cyclic nucleotide-binding domain-containing protein n=1 Tax=Phaeomonas parva TaxID=124430 RepID=A0A7S1TYD3_9STRA